MSFTNFNDVAKSKNQEVVLTHVATNTTVAFPAFLTEYRDTYQAVWIVTGKQAGNATVVFVAT